MRHKKSNEESRCSFASIASSGGRNRNESYSVVNSTIRDVFRMQQDALTQIRNAAQKEREARVLRSDFDQCREELEKEKLSRSTAEAELKQLREKCDFLAEENGILKRQLNKEREAHDATANHSKAKSVREQSRIDFLHRKCLEAKDLLEAQQHEIEEKDTEIEALRSKLKAQKDNYKHVKDEIDLSKLQQSYFAKSMK